MLKMKRVVSPRKNSPRSKKRKLTPNGFNLSPHDSSLNESGSHQTQSNSIAKQLEEKIEMMKKIETILAELIVKKFEWKLIKHNLEADAYHFYDILMKRINVVMRKLKKLEEKIKDKNVLDERDNFNFKVYKSESRDVLNANFFHELEKMVLTYRLHKLGELALERRIKQNNFSGFESD